MRNVNGITYGLDVDTDLGKTLSRLEHETCFASFQTACIHMQVVYKKSNRITAILMALGKVGHNKVLSIEQRIMDCWGDSFNSKRESRFNELVPK